MKTLKKIIICALCWGAIIGFSIYETNSIIDKEYQRQSEIASEAHEKIGFNLDMIKIAVMTEDLEVYEKNIVGIKEQIAVISPLGLISSEQKEFLESVEGYIKLLENKTELLKEIKRLKEQMSLIKDKLNENYGDKDAITREKVKESKDLIQGLKIETSDYTEESILTVINETNGAIDELSSKSSTLADCIDTCYKNRIKEINDELAEKLKSFAEKVDNLNSNLEKEFELDKMEEIKGQKHSNSE